MKHLGDNFYVTPQIQIEDLDRLKMAGICHVINNQAEGETPGQVTSSQMELAVRAKGMKYSHIPMPGGQMTLEQIEGLRSIMTQSDIPICAYCLSGTRSAILWMFANVGKIPIDELMSRAGAAGYHLSHLKDSLESYAKQFN